MTRLTATAVRKEFADTVNRVSYKGERIIVRRGRKDLVAMISVKELALFERLLERFADLSDIKAAQKALRESDERIPYERLRRELRIAG